MRRADFYTTPCAGAGILTTIVAQKLRRIVSRELWGEQLLLIEPSSQRTATDWRLNGYADPSALVGFLKSLRTLRTFEQHKPVPENVLQAVLEVARSSGSARNRQPWEFVVVRDRKTLESLAACEGRAAHLANAAVGIVLVIVGSRSSLETRPSTRGGSLRGSRSQPASYGVASSVGWFKGQGREKAKEILGIPQPKLVRTVLSLGYPTSPPEGGRLALPKGRKPLSELVHEERYGRRELAAEGTDVDGARSSYRPKGS